MRFRLTYTGDLKPRKKASADHIHQIRLQLHEQLKILWRLDPLDQIYWTFFKSRNEPERICEDREGIRFLPIVTKKLHFICHLDILFMRPQPPGGVVGHGGDIDNRMKTLFDALRVPSSAEIKQSNLSAPNSELFHCLLQDDELISKVTFESDRLLVENSAQESLIVINVTVGKSKSMAFNTDYASF